ncbi:DUF4215 domain-containing protein [Chondromyces apiculatus]|uniref:P/Homo B domain-containing protein n=1 Tax=Chondromyces apiculatus DSM 436 TaxID=1192034 RepID=A0A017TDV1_9BACT|nr:DUF4215 domain-containing protein [Chondromyces apiculatus]EYF06985.1 Hypothetical protein CAP_1244 [Chondromyces apiculatus DSM 436]
MSGSGGEGGTGGDGQGGTGAQGGQGGAGGQGGQGGAGGSPPMPCTMPTECPTPQNACEIAACTDGVCGADPAPAGTVIGAQTAGDCQQAVCDGNRGTTTQVDDTDLPDDANDCTFDECDGGTIVHTPEPSGTGCDDGAGGVVCDGSGQCVFAECGDAVVDGPEVCDDGNLTDGDGCDANCTETACGNGIATDGEACDDGNAVNGDGCDANCTETACGNGIRAGLEVCDDGNTVSGDGCSASCNVQHNYTCTGTPSVCHAAIELNCNDGIDGDGDGFIDCADTDCAAGCSASFLGCGPDQALYVVPSRDLPLPIKDLQKTTSTVAVENIPGIIKAAVWIDMLHTYDADLDISLIPPSGTVFDLSSDNGSSNDNYTATLFDTACATAVTSGAAPYTGCFRPEGSLAPLAGTNPSGYWALQAYDDASALEGTFNAWSLILCTAPASCGNGLLDGNEECDDGNDDDTDACLGTCRIATCGDSVIQTGVEGCDDGNPGSGDGCSSACQVEPGFVCTPATPSVCYRPETEPNNACGATNPPLTPNPSTRIAAEINPIGDQDYFPFVVPAMASVEIDTFTSLDGEACATGNDTVIELRGPDCTTVLVSDDDGGISPCSKIAPATDVQARRLAPGTYYVRVEEYGNNLNIPQYSLRIRFPSLCGNGALETYEVCDDGNLVDGDGCQADCTITPGCGNGLLEGTEVCDDGNTASGDGCSGACAIETGYFCAGTPSVCVMGTGETEPNNACGTVSGPLNPAPNASIIGAITPIGDLDFYSFVVPATATVDIETFSGVTPGACAAIDTVIQLRGPDCNTILVTQDQGGVGNCSRINPASVAAARKLAPGTYYVRVADYLNDGTIPAYNLQVRFTSLCGNGTVEPYEACDDGNLVNGDGCQADCSPTPACGNGIVETGEQCDDGNLNAGDGCAAACAIEPGYACLGSPSVCVPGTADIEPNNACGQVSGPLTPNPTASAVGAITPIGDLDFYSFVVPATATVDIETFSGTTSGACTGIDTVIQLRGQDCTTILVEQDQGGIGNCSKINPTSVTAARKLAPGTYYVRVADYLNNDAIPAYNLRVQFTALCGNGTLEPYEACDDGNLVNGDGCQSDCTPTGVCGNGIVETGEQCDDGNVNAGDGCAAACTREPGYACIGTPSVCVLGTPDIEPNNACGQVSGPLTPNPTASAVGAITPIGDLDFYSFVVPATATVDIETFSGTTSGVCTGIDTVIQLRGQDCTTILVEQDQGGIGNCSKINPTSVTAARKLAPGTYYVRVADYLNNDAIPAYNLRVQFTALCGNGAVEPYEACDDGNLVSGDGCQADCTLTPVCGNGVIEVGEACDDGNVNAGDGCAATCTIETGYACGGTPYACIPVEHETEPNNACGTVSGPYLPDPIVDINGAITPSGDQDFYSFVVPATATVDIETFSGTTPGVCTSIDTQIQLRGPDCTTVLVTQDQGGIGNCSKINPTSVAAARKLAPGTYFIRVEEYGNDGTIPAYNLRVQFTALCGNGAVEPYEACDDGNLVNGDGCQADCTLTPGCGNGALDAGEGCDDGNNASGDGCSAICAIETGYACGGTPYTCIPSTLETEPNNACGTVSGPYTPNPFVDINGAITPGTDLDFYSFVVPATATVDIETFSGTVPGACASIDTQIQLRGPDCTTVLVTQDQGGIGNCSKINPTSVAAARKLAPGTYFIRVEEYGNNATIPAYNMRVRFTALCGNGAVEPYETCDDGNLVNGDGCQADCTITPICGNGIVEAGEACDDGDLQSGDGCSATCTIETGYTCGGTPYVCVPFTLETEPNNACGTVTGPLTPAPIVDVRSAITPIGDQDFYSFVVPATATVDIETFSGTVPGECVSLDTLIQLRGPNCTTVIIEDDDDGLSTCSKITPSTDAAVRRLAPGTYFIRVEEYENNALVPAYNMRIQFTALCGNGVLEPYEVCDDGNLVNGDGCQADCTITPACGDGFQEAGEACDDANVTAGDGCSATCTVEAGFFCAGTYPTTCGRPEVEPNNTSVDADARALDATPVVFTHSGRVSGAITPAADVDRYRVELAAPSTVRFETFDGAGITCPTTGLSTALRIYSATGVELYADTTTGINSCSALIVNLPAGVYYAQVAAASTTTTIAAYQLEVHVQADLGVETEPNETQATANHIYDSNVFALGGHQVQTDSDFFAVVVPLNGMSILAEVIEGGAETCESNGVDSRLTLYSPSGAQLVDDDNAGRGNCSRLDGTGSTGTNTGAHNLTAGIYYLQVRASSTSSTQTGPNGQFDYRLAVTVRAP